VTRLDASRQPRQEFICVALELVTHMQWTLAVSRVFPVVVMLVVEVVWHCFRAALQVSQAGHWAVVWWGMVRVRVKRARGLTMCFCFIVLCLGVVLVTNDRS